MKKVLKSIITLSVISGFMLALGGCSTVPKGSASTVQMNGVHLQASGAGIIKADAQNTTFRIKCGVCGKESEELVIPTPLAGKPYTLNYVCPRCGHKQKIVIQAV